MHDKSFRCAANFHETLYIHTLYLQAAGVTDERRQSSPFQSCRLLRLGNMKAACFDMKDHCCRRSLQSPFQIWVSTLQRCIRFYFTYTVCSVLQDVDLSSSRSHTNPNVVVTFFCPAIRFWEPILAPTIFCLQVPVMAHSFHQHHQTWTDKSAILLMTMWTAQSVRTPLWLF